MRAGRRTHVWFVAAVIASVVVASGGDASAAESRTTTTTAPSARTNLPITVDSPADLPGYHVYRPRDLAAAGRRLPVVVWANGGCLRFDGVWAPLLRSWAAAGMVVIAIAAPPSGSTATGMTTPADQGAGIDWAVRQNGLAGGRFKGKLDLERIVAAGNSCGGVTSVRLAGSDRRVATVFVLSGSGSFPGTPIDEANAVMARVHVPIAYVTGGPQDISRPNVAQDYAGLTTGVPAYVARRDDGDHPTVSTAESILVDEVSGIGLKWFALVFNRSRKAQEQLVSNPCPACAPGTWAVESKNLDSLVRPKRTR
jgi:hypothetical protein